MALGEGQGVGEATLAVLELTDQGEVGGRTAQLFAQPAGEPAMLIAQAPDTMGLHVLLQMEARPGPVGLGVRRVTDPERTRGPTSRSPSIVRGARSRNG